MGTLYTGQIVRYDSKYAVKVIAVTDKSVVLLVQYDKDFMANIGKETATTAQQKEYGFDPEYVGQSIYKLSPDQAKTKLTEFTKKYCDVCMQRADS